LKILKYNKNHLATDLFGRHLIHVHSKSNNEQYRKNQKNFFKPRIKINHDLIKSQIQILVELNDGNIKKFPINIWSLKIQNKNDKFPWYSTNATNCECNINIIQNETSLKIAKLFPIESLTKLEFPSIHSNNKDIGIDEFIQKVCKLFDNKIKFDQDIDRGTSQEFPFIITLENIDFFYILIKQNTIFDYTEANFSEETYTVNPKKFEFDKYEIDIKINCNERKDERGKRYTLDINSWEDVKLTHL
jgi:hypothetical protein